MNMKKFSVVLITIIVIFSLISRNKEEPVEPKVINTPAGEVFINEDAFDYCQQKGGRIEMSVNPEGGVMQLCAFGEEPNIKRCGIYSFYEGTCKI